MNINGEIYIFRALTLHEIEFVNKNFKKENEVEEVICQLAVLFPSGINFSVGVKAGIPNRLSRVILENSLILNKDQPLEKLEQFRVKMTQLQYQAETAIMTAFPQVTLKEIRDWDVETVMDWLARAEWALQNIHNLPVSFKKEEDILEEDMEDEEDYDEEEGNEFAESGWEEDEEEELSPVQRLAKELRAQGKDPMIELGPMIMKKPSDGYVPLPLIGGTNAWQKDEVLNRVREQLQYVIRKRT